MANLHLVTGFAGQEHITAIDQGAFNAALIGTGDFVLDKGKVFEAQIITNNQIRILDGELMMQGRFVRLNPDTYADLTIESGAQGKKRNDLIVARYTKDNVTGVEECNLVVIKGTEVASNPVDPEYTVGDITNGNSYLHDYPLWRIPLDGLSVGEPVALFGEPFMDSMRTLPEMRETVNKIYSELDEKANEIYGEVEDICQEEVGFLHDYTWKRRTVGDIEVKTAISGEITIAQVSSSSDRATLQYSSSVTLNDDGTVSLAEPINTLQINPYNYPNVVTQVQNIVPCYIVAKNNKIYYLPAESTFTTSEEDNTYTVKCYTFNVRLGASAPISVRASEVSVGTGYGEYEIVTSDNRNAYPDSGLVGGYEYEYLGIPKDMIYESTKFVYGSYTGTDTYGKGSPNVLTFEFKPKVVIVQHGTSGCPAVMVRNAPITGWLNGPSTGAGSNSAYINGLGVTWDENSVSYYNTGSAANQLNKAGYTYYYVAIG